MKHALIALTTVALAAGCTSAGSATHGPGDPTTPRHPTPHPRTVVITEKDAGHVVHVHRGDVVRWMLHSTYWTLRRATGGELARIGGQPVTVPSNPGHTCVPGQGCGTVEADYRAEHAGRVTLSAYRRLCGEAMLCVGGRGRFSVTLVVA